MNQTVIKIGNSVGIILPHTIREENGIKVGDTIEINPTLTKGNILLSKIEKKKTPKISAKFAQMVDEFMTEHKDVLEELAKK